MCKVREKSLKKLTIFSKLISGASPEYVHFKRVFKADKNQMLVGAH